MTKKQEDTADNQTEKISVSTTDTAHAANATANKSKKLLSEKVLLFIIFVLIAALPSVYFYQKSRQAEANFSSSDTSKKAVINAVVGRVGKIILLPAGETPTLATVTDVHKVSDQTFFRNAKNGDKVLVYTQAGQAFLYRPSENRIIAVAPLSINSQPAGTKQ